MWWPWFGDRGRHQQYSVLHYGPVKGICELYDLHGKTKRKRLSREESSIHCHINITDETTFVFVGCLSSYCLYNEMYSASNIGIRTRDETTPQVNRGSIVLRDFSQKKYVGPMGVRRDPLFSFPYSSLSP